MIGPIRLLLPVLASILIAMIPVVTLADEIRWAARTDVGAPEPRAGHVMAYDSDRGVTVMFGGHRLDDFYLIYFNDTWEYDGIAWRRITIDGPSPLPRTASAMCYDSARHEMVLCAGWNDDVDQDDGYMKDTWVYRPAAPGHGVWVQKAPLSSSFNTTRLPRAGHAMVFDSRRNVAVLMGGTLGENSDLDAPDYDRDSHVFQWNGERWGEAAYLFGLQDQPGSFWYEGPTGHSMVFDSDEGITSVSGGRYYYMTHAQGSTNWRDIDWPYFFPINRRNPPANGYFYETPDRLMPFGGTDVGTRQGHASAYDSDRKRIVIFGGNLAGEDTVFATDPGGRHDEVRFYSRPDGSWDYAGTRLYIPTPPPRELHAMVYDSRRQRIVLFGGSRNVSNQFYNDTWEYGPGVVPNIYVNAAHTGPQDGSAASPFKNVTGAINAASPVDLTNISLAAGDYLESPLTIDKPVRLEAANGPVTVR